MPSPLSRGPKTSRKGRRDVRKLRSPADGWRLVQSFTTDGRSMSLLYENPRRGETAVEKRTRENAPLPESKFVATFGPNDRKLGGDPG